MSEHKKSQTNSTGGPGGKGFASGAPGHIVGSGEKAKNFSKTMKNLRIAQAKSTIDQAEYFDYKIINYNNKAEQTIEKVVKILDKY